MAKLKPDPIQKSDLVEYLESYSDFSFELSVLKMLRENGLQCKHSGLYEDPVTGKSRQFDIRAIRTINQKRVRLAVECKNLRDNFPVLISCIPRHESESYHQVAIVSEPEWTGIHGGVLASRAKIVSIRGKYSIYKPNDLVGKSTVQVGRTLEGTISANDTELYDKWSQCLSSSADLVSEIYWDGQKDKSLYFSLMIPIVVVPNGRLWSVAYNDDGIGIAEPSETNRCSCFIGKDYKMGTKFAGTTILISHLEIMTFDGLKAFVKSHLESDEGMWDLFSKEGLSGALGKATTPA
jgi:hypothetical protein